MSYNPNLSSKGGKRLSPPPLKVKAHICAYDDIASHRTMSPSNLERSTNFKLYENKFSESFSNRTNRDLAAQLAEVKRVTDATTARIQYTLDFAEKVDPTKNGVGSAGGHIARKLGARGPLNGTAKLKSKYPFTAQQLFSKTKGDMHGWKNSVVKNPTWEENFVVHKTLEPAQLLKHPSKRRDTSKLALEIEVADILNNRGITPLPEARPASRKSRLTQHVPTLKKLGVDAYRVKVSNDNTPSSPNKSISRATTSGQSEVLLESGGSLLLATEMVRPYTTGSYNPAEYIASNQTSLLSIDLSPITDSRRLLEQFQAFDNSRITDSRSTSESGRVQNHNSNAVNHQATLEVFVEKIDKAIARILQWIHEQGQSIQEIDCIILSKKLESQQSQLSCLPFMCYICVLLGLPPTIESAIQLFGKHSAMAVNFLRTVDPFNLPIRSVRKATLLKEKLIDPNQADESVSVHKFAPEWKLRSWIKLFHVLSEVLTAVFNSRKSKLTVGSLSSVVAPTDFYRGVAKTETPRAGEYAIGDTLEDINEANLDENSYKLLVRKKFCMDLISDQSCYDFWRVVFSDDAANNEIMKSETDLKDIVNDGQDVMFIDVNKSTDSNLDCESGDYGEESFDGDGSSQPVKPPVDEDLILGIERAAAAEAVASAHEARRRSFGRAASMPRLSSVVVSAVGTAIATVKLAEAKFIAGLSHNSIDHHHQQQHNHPHHHQQHNHHAHNHHGHPGHSGVHSASSSPSHTHHNYDQFPDPSLCITPRPQSAHPYYHD